MLFCSVLYCIVFHVYLSDSHASAIFQCGPNLLLTCPDDPFALQTCHQSRVSSLVTAHHTTNMRVEASEVGWKQ